MITQPNRGTWRVQRCSAHRLRCAPGRRGRPASFARHGAAVKFTIVIVRPDSYRYSDCFKEVAETVMFGLRSLGHEAEITENMLRHNTTHIFFGGHLLPADSTLPEGSILYNLEQVNGGNTGNLDILCRRYTMWNFAKPNCHRRYTMWDFAKPNCDEWAKRRVRAVHVPLGYSPEMTRIQPTEQDIDVLFYGSMSGRRAAVLKQLQKLGLNVVVRINNAYGAELDALIARARLILNIHFCDAQLFEIVRVGYALANRKAVVSEQSVDDYPTLEDGIKIVPYLALVDACIELIQKPELRHEYEAKGFDKFRTTPETSFLEAALS